MTMLRIGCVVLSIWLLLNLVPSAIIVVNTITGRGHTPAIYTVLNRDVVDKLDSDVIATIDSIAVYANLTNIGLCTLALFTVWIGIDRLRLRWAFWALLFGLVAALFAGVAADFVVGWVFPEINIISAVILVAGFSVVGFELFKPRSA